MNIRNDHDLVQQVLDGSISHEAFKAFQHRLRQEPELVGLYRQYALLHHSLCEEYEGRQLQRQPRRSAAFRKPRKDYWTTVAATVGAAAVVVFGLLLFRTGGRAKSPRLPAMAQVTFSEDAVWSVKGSHRSNGQTSQLDPGAIIQLEQGQARLDFGAGAVAVVDGNTELEFITPESLRLGHGRGRFRVDTPGRKLQVATPAMTAVDLGTEFGMLSQPGRPDEVHVFEGRVQVKLPQAADGPVLAAGDAARVLDHKSLERMPVAMPRFPKNPPQFTTILDDRFDSPAEPAALDGRNPRQGLGIWRVSSGSPRVANGRLESGDFTAFCKLPPGSLSDRTPVLLATLETTEPLQGKFHTDGWAGLSFYQDGRELLFFGDGFGDEKTWSIDIKQGQPVVLPKQRVVGRRTVTLCYHRATGAASLHEGALPLGPAFVSGTLPAGLNFDEIRIGASAEAVLPLVSLTVRTGESGTE